MEEKKIYFIADTHFGHKNIIKYESRPFESVIKMDEEIIENWNKIVMTEDRIFVLGDFSFYEKTKTTDILSHLNGEKILVKGNHDTKSSKYYMECGFENVYEYPVILDGFWILSHEPMYINSNMPYVNIFGHVHSNKIYSDYTNQSFCACLERCNYSPIEFSEVKRIIGLKHV